LYIVNNISLHLIHLLYHPFNKYSNRFLPLLRWFFLIPNRINKFVDFKMYYVLLIVFNLNPYHHRMWCAVDMEWPNRRIKDWGAINVGSPLLLHFTIIICYRKAQHFTNFFPWGVVIAIPNKKMKYLEDHIHQFMNSNKKESKPAYYSPSKLSAWQPVSLSLKVIEWSVVRSWKTSLLHHILSSNQNW
jgi:hypothetical protein